MGCSKLLKRVFMALIFAPICDSSSPLTIQKARHIQEKISNTRLLKEVYNLLINHCSSVYRISMLGPIPNVNPFFKETEQEKPPLTKLSSSQDQKKKPSLYCQTNNDAQFPFHYHKPMDLDQKEVLQEEFTRLSVRLLSFFTDNKIKTLPIITEIKKRGGGKLKY